MRSPRMIYLAVAAVLVVAGFVLTDYIADRSAPELGDGVVLVPAGNPTSGPNPSTPPIPTTQPSTTPSNTPTVGPTGTSTQRPGEALPVSPRPVQTAGTDDDDDSDDIDDD